MVLPPPSSSPAMTNPSSIANPRQSLCVRLTRWPIARHLRRARPLWGKPVVVVGTAGQRRFVVDRSTEAAVAGVRHGMALAEAKALCPLTCLDHDPVADRRAVEALGRWMTRFTPTVAVGWADDDGDARSASALFLDVTGCERLFGGMKQLAAMLATSLRAFRIPAAIAIAPTPGAGAWSSARASGSATAV